MTGGLGPLQGMGLDGALEWRLAKTEGGTRITLWYRAGGYTPDDLTKFVPVVDQVQGVQLGGLADYLRAKARATARKDRLADRIHKPLDRIARASRRRNPAPRDELMRAAYLVDRGSISRFAELVALLQRANDGVQVLCTGPWPPYSFVGE
jgi:hypothetical protein